jgi:hypothetical protein
MNDDREKALELLMDQQLRQLPYRKAPGSLAPRVLAAIRAQAHKPWYQRPLATWARWLQVVTLMLATGIGAGLAWAISLAVESLDFGAVARNLGSSVERFDFIWTAGAALGNALLIVLGRTHPLFLIAAGLLCIVSYASCVGMGTLLYRLASNRS